MVGEPNFAPAQEGMAKLLVKYPEIDDEGVTDLNIRGGRPASIRRGGASEMLETIADNADIAALGNLMATAFNVELNERSPTLEKRLPPKWRVTMTHPSIEQDGRWDCSIRFLPTTTRPIGEYVETGAMDLATAHRLVELARTRNTMLIAGAMGAGKTTLLRSIIGEIPARDRLVVIEDRAELNIERPNMSALTSTEYGRFEDLIAHTMSKDANVIVVGEVRDRSACEFITIASSGHPCMTTMHSDRGEQALIRLLNLVRLKEPNYADEALRGAINAVCHVRLDPMTGRRQVTLWEPER